jgi:hypothetical protein
MRSGLKVGPRFGHLLRMSDDTGLLEHARGAVPRRRHGYCVDDVARGLVVVSRQPARSEPIARLGGMYLAFLDHAQADDGQSHNRLSYERRWEDEAGTGDWWGRSLWGSGTAVARHPSVRLRADALGHFETGAACRSAAPRAMAFATVGAAEVLTAHPGHEGALRLIADAAQILVKPLTSLDWPWPEPRLTYANAVWAEAVMLAGWALGDDRLIVTGVDLLDWLLTVETTEGRFSVTPVGGWGPGEERPGFDQQPIEVAALADACARAFDLTGQDRFAAGVTRAVAWFLGDNDAKQVMFDAFSGGGYDGLHRNGHNDNQGAESTLALLSTLQHGLRLTGPAA